jgi:predicted TIM-barrel fold metal-dependent hydrolase
MIIDAHTHIFPPEVVANREAFRARDALFDTLYRNPRARLATVEDLLQEMDQAGVAVAVVCGFGWADPGLCQAHNDYLIDCVRRYPDRLIGFAAIQPLAGPAALAEVERCRRQGLRGIGELMPHGQGYHLDDSHLLAPLAEAAIALGMPILTHTSEPVGHLYPGKGEVTVRTVYHLIQHFPDLVLICGHWGGGLPFYELMPEVRAAARHVYYDTAASPFLYEPRIYRIAVDLVGAGKILFGSDFPLLRQRRCLAEVRQAGLPATVVDQILGENARRLFGLDGATDPPLETHHG